MNRSALVALAALPLLVLAACAETTGTTNGGTSSEAQPAKDDKPKYTSEQQSAIDAAQNYVDTMPFSRAGLVTQLTSEFDQFPKKDAVFAVDHIKVDWNAEAVEAVKNYKDTMPMSREGMIDQLTSSAGDKFTPKQARYAVDKAY